MVRGGGGCKIYDAAEGHLSRNHGNLLKGRRTSRAPHFQCAAIDFILFLFIYDGQTPLFSLYSLCSFILCLIVFFKFSQLFSNLNLKNNNNKAHLKREDEEEEEIG